MAHRLDLSIRAKCIHAKLRVNLSRGGGPLDPLVKGLVDHSSEAELMGMIHKIYLRMVAIYLLCSYLSPRRPLIRGRANGHDPQDLLAHGTLATCIAIYLTCAWHASYLLRHGGVLLMRNVCSRFARAI
jgi:hypothetical protein